MLTWADIAYSRDWARDRSSPADIEFILHHEFLVQAERTPLPPAAKSRGTGHVLGTVLIVNAGSRQSVPYLVQAAQIVGEAAVRRG